MSRLVGWFTAGLLVCAAIPARADTIYLNEAAFLLDAGPVTMESFEALALSSTDVSSVDAGAFAISTTANSLRVRNTAVLGSHATDGSQYVRFDGINSRSVLFSFDVAINRFGVTLTDALESGINPAISLTTNGGANFPSAMSGVQPDGSERFLGLIADNSFTQLTLTWNLADGIGMDEVLFANVAPAAIPEPGSLLLLGSGALAAIAKARMRRR
jgi:PEP-CTERM motif-containing protein